MFTEMDRAFSASGDKKRENDGAKRVFFGGERFLEGISGQAYVSEFSVLKLYCFYVIKSNCLLPF